MSSPASDPPPDITPVHLLLVASDDCHFCLDARAILDRLRGDYPLNVREVQLSSPEGRDLAARHGIAFPPGLFIEDRFIGFGRVSERKLRRLLEQLKAETPGNGQV
ncbi:MAG TPA: thioredoxin family protein [Chloroflexota bacterium]|nr:thioredoxin family protein [Chloroflexota bacterium]